MFWQGVRSGGASMAACARNLSHRRFISWRWWGGPVSDSSAPKKRRMQNQGAVSWEKKKHCRQDGTEVAPFRRAGGVQRAESHFSLGILGIGRDAWEVFSTKKHVKWGGNEAGKLPRIPVHHSIPVSKFTSKILITSRFTSSSFPFSKFSSRFFYSKCVLFPHGQ